MATILQNCIFWISQCDVLWKPVYVSRSLRRCKETFVREIQEIKLISEHSHWRTCTSCAPNVKPKLKFTQFLYNFWCYQAFPHLRFSASWLCPVDLQPSWMAEMPSVWFRSCYSFKIFSTCKIFFHLCFNGNRGLQKCPAPWGWSQVPSTLLTHLESCFCSTARSGKPSPRSMKGIWRTR